MQIDTVWIVMATRNKIRKPWKTNEKKKKKKRWIDSGKSWCKKNELFCCLGNGHQYQRYQFVRECSIFCWLVFLLMMVWFCSVHPCLRIQCFWHSFDFRFEIRKQTKICYSAPVVLRFTILNRIKLLHQIVVCVFYLRYIHQWIYAIC